MSAEIKAKEYIAWPYLVWMDSRTFVFCHSEEEAIGYFSLWGGGKGSCRPVIYEISQNPVLNPPRE